MNYKVIYLYLDSARDFSIVELLPKTGSCFLLPYGTCITDNKAMVRVHTCKQYMNELGQRKKNHINKQRTDIERLHDEKLWRADLYIYEIIKLNFQIGFKLFCKFLTNDTTISAHLVL